MEMIELIPRTHIDILESSVKGLLSTITGRGLVCTRFCNVTLKDDKLLIDSIAEDQLKHLQSHGKISVIVVDPINVDRWLSIQGTASDKEANGSRYRVDIRNVITFQS
jgi:hypothetical protein